MNYTVDTSALMRLYIPDGPVPDGLRKALQNAERGNDTLIAPELILAEAGQVLHKKRAEGVVSDEETEALLDSILALPLRLFSHRDLLPVACDLAAEINLTVYDALFLALAQRHNAALFTADEKLGRAAKKLNLLGGLPHFVGEGLG